MEATGADPLPFGLEPNRKVIEELVNNAYMQGIITKPVKPEDVLVPETWGLVG